MMTQRTAAILGGSFDPPHMGHQLAVCYLLGALGYDDVWLVPSFEHPFGKHMQSFEHRLAMCRLMAQPFGAAVRVLDVEQDLAAQNSLGRTLPMVQTLVASHSNVGLVYVATAAPPLRVRPPISLPVALRRVLATNCPVEIS